MCIRDRGEAAKQMGITIPESVKEAVNHPKQFEAFVDVYKRQS